MDSQCLFFTYHVTAKICYLKPGLGTSTSLEPYYISGPKYCGFSTGIFVTSVLLSIPISDLGEKGHKIIIYYSKEK